MKVRFEKNTNQLGLKSYQTVVANYFMNLIFSVNCHFLLLFPQVKTQFSL